MAENSVLTEEETSQLIELIQASDALTPPEKQYWADLLPSMDTEQIDQLKGILDTEQQKMKQIDEKYDEKLEEVSEKYVKKWDAEKLRAARVARQQEEKGSREESKEKAEELLAGWE
ncbi:MAG: hypothetical protein P1V18_02845 [Candidatus Gracilibacteria bacterium]|nr:hypothetical protein [Candidatus Gracilibacteria bacterium]